MLGILGTINDDPVRTVKRLMTGLEYTVQKDIREPEYGWCNVNIGRVSLTSINFFGASLGSSFF